MFFQSIFWNRNHMINQLRHETIWFRQAKNCFATWYEIIICAKFCVSFWSISKARGGAKSKNKHLSWLYCTLVGLSEAVTGGVLEKNLLLKISQCHQETPLLESQELQTCNFIRKRPKNRCFPVNIAKFLKLPLLKSICKQLLFGCFMGSLLHGPKGSRSRLYDGVTSLVFFPFKLISLVLNQVPTCVENLSRIPLMSHLSFYIGYIWSF